MYSFFKDTRTQWVFSSVKTVMKFFHLDHLIGFELHLKSGTVLNETTAKPPRRNLEPRLHFYFLLHLTIESSFLYPSIVISETAPVINER